MWRPRDPVNKEIDAYTLKFLVGMIALMLPVVELSLVGFSITSISASYFADDQNWPRNVFVGSLFAIASFLFGYKGQKAEEMVLSKIACLAALCIALFPCDCKPDGEIVKYAHGIASAILFAVLGRFCFIFHTNAQDKLKRDPRNRKALRRSRVYRGCLGGMVLAAALYGAKLYTGRDNLLFIAEAIGLFSFGISWLTASRVIPFLAQESDRKHLLAERGASQQHRSTTNNLAHQGAAEARERTTA